MCRYCVGSALRRAYEAPDAQTTGECCRASPRAHSAEMGMAASRGSARPVRAVHSARQVTMRLLVRRGAVHRARAPARAPTAMRAQGRPGRRRGSSRTRRPSEAGRGSGRSSAQSSEGGGVWEGEEEGTAQARRLGSVAGRHSFARRRRYSIDHRLTSPVGFSARAASHRMCRARAGASTPRAAVCSAPW